jgi:hypothetical protein
MIKGSGAFTLIKNQSNSEKKVIKKKYKIIIDHRLMLLLLLLLLSGVNLNTQTTQSLYFNK